MVGEYGGVLVMDWGLAKGLGGREEQEIRSARMVMQIKSAKNPDFRAGVGYSLR